MSQIQGILLTALLSFQNLVSAAGSFDTFRPVFPDAEQETSSRLVIYSSNRDEETEAVLAAFEQQYPDLDVQLVSMTADQCIQTIESQADNPEADVMWGGMSFSVYESHPDLWEAYVSENIDQSNESFVNQDGTYTNYALYGTVLLASDSRLQLLNRQIQSYEDLLDQIYQGEIAMGDPQNNIPASIDLSGLLAAAGGTDSQDAWDYARALKTNMDGLVISSAPVVADTIRNGKYTVGLTSEKIASDALVKKADDNMRQGWKDEKNERPEYKSVDTTLDIVDILKLNAIRASGSTFPNISKALNNLAQTVQLDVVETMIEQDQTTWSDWVIGQRGPDTLSIIYPKEGSLWIPESAAIVKNAPNLKAAQQFIDFLLSDTAQEILAGLNIRGVNTSINPTGPQLKPWDEISVLSADIRSDDAKQWNEMEVQYDTAIQDNAA